MVYLRYSKLAERLSLFGFDKIRLAWHWWHGSMASIPVFHSPPLEIFGTIDQQVIVVVYLALRGNHLDESS